jgi:predicted transcriptional regulator
MVTTIQLSDETKHKLDVLKKKNRLSYDQIVQKLLNANKKLELREQIADYYAVHAKADAAEVTEWQHTETDK